MMKRNLWGVAFCLALVPFVTGCVEDEANANNGGTTDAKAQAESPPLRGDKLSNRSPLNLVEVPTDDPLVQHAMLMRDEVAALEQELLERLDELRAQLEAAQANPEKLRESVESFIDLTRDMKRKTTQAGESISRVAEKTVQLSRSIRHLGFSYRKLAELFRQKARDYTEKKLRDQMIQFAADYDAMAYAIPERAKALDGAQRKLPALKRKVREVDAFLTDATAFLSSHPQTGSDPRERYAGEFESFAVTFSEWIRTLEELRQSLRQDAVSKVIQDSYRTELANLQKVEDEKREEQQRIEQAKADELAQAEQAKRDEEARIAHLAEEKERELARERERLAKEKEKLAQAKTTLVKSTTPRDPTRPMGISLVSRSQGSNSIATCSPVIYYSFPTPSRRPVTYYEVRYYSPVVYVRPSPCRVR